MLRSRSHHAVEALESRIAPAAVTLNFFDQDNHAVHVTASKGTVAQLATALGVAEGATAAGPLSFHFDTSFKGADISVTAGSDLTDSILTRVEFINAEGIDLGNVTVDGELDHINVGDSNSTTAALKNITVGTFGDGTAYDSVVIGGITAFTVKGDFNGAYIKIRGSDSEDPNPNGHVTDGHGRIGTLFIGGDLLGTDRVNGGHIWATGDITKITVVGSVKGFAAATAPTTPPTDQNFSGRIFSGGLITTVTVGTDAAAGGVFGGDGAFSGQIVGAAGITTTTIKGDVKGGLGIESGAIGAGGNLNKIVLTGSLIGGAGSSSGTLLSHTSITTVNIGGNIEGGAGFNSGAIGTEVLIGTVVVTGDVIGGSGASSGQIVSQGKINSVTIHSLIGGSNFESGAIGSIKGLGKIVLNGDLIAGSGERSGLIATAQVPDDRRIGFAEKPIELTPANAPITSVTIAGSIIGYVPFEDVDSGAGSASILSSGALGPVIVKGAMVGGEGFQSGRIASDRSIASVNIGGYLRGSSGEQSGTIFAGTTLGAVKIGDPLSDTANTVKGEDSLPPAGVFGGEGDNSGSISGDTIASVEIFGGLFGGGGYQSGSIKTLGNSTNGKLGPVFIHGNLEGGSGDGPTFAEQSGSIISAGALTSVTIKTNGIGLANIVGSSSNEGGSIFSDGPMGAVVVEGSITGGDGAGSGRIQSFNTIASVKVGGQVNGGDGDDSGAIQSSGGIGSVLIGTPDNTSSHDLVGGAGTRSGSIISGGKINSVTVRGYVLGGDGPSSGYIATQSEGPVDIGSIFIGRSVIGSNGSSAATNSGSIFSSGKIGSITIGDPADTNTENGGSLSGGIAFGSGSISAQGDIGAIKVKTGILGGTGDESGKIASNGKIASLTVGSAAFGGSITGGIGNYDTTVESSNAQLGQIFAKGSIGPVVIFGNLSGNQIETESGTSGSYSGVINAASIASVVVKGSINGGLGQRSGGILTSGNLGAVTANNLLGGDGNRSGFLSAEGNIASVNITGTVSGGDGSGSAYIAAGKTLGPVNAGFLSGHEGGRVRISAGNMITSVTVHETVGYADILAGYDTNGNAVNGDAQIGTVKIGVGTGPGLVEATNIVAGISAGSDGRFGDFDDIPIGAGFAASTPHSKIASIIIAGSVTASTNTDDHYGFVAATVAAVKIGTGNLVLKAGALNDFYLPVAAISDTSYGEFPSIG